MEKGFGEEMQSLLRSRSTVRFFFPPTSSSVSLSSMSFGCVFVFQPSCLHSTNLFAPPYNISPSFNPPTTQPHPPHFFCKMTHREVEPEWKVEAETAAAAQAEQSMEWVKRRAAEADAVEAEKAAKTAALAKAEAARVQLRNDAIAMFDSEGAENAPFSLSLDTRSGEAINSKWRGFKGQGEVQSVNFSNDGIFTVRNWSDDKKDGTQIFVFGKRLR